MRDQKRRSGLIRLIFSMSGGAVLGGFLGFASAQERPPGQLDATCFAQCAENGNEAAYCERVCWLPDPTVAGRNDPVYWPCYGSCRERGGKPEVCLAACRKR